MINNKRFQELRSEVGIESAKRIFASELKVKLIGIIVDFLLNKKYITKEESEEFKNFSRYF